ISAGPQVAPDPELLRPCKSPTFTQRSTTNHVSVVEPKAAALFDLILTDFVVISSPQSAFLHDRDSIVDEAKLRHKSHPPVHALWLAHAVRNSAHWRANIGERWRESRCHN